MQALGLAIAKNPRRVLWHRRQWPRRSKVKPRPRAAETWVASQTSSPRTGSRFDRRANRSMIPAICLDPLYPGLLTEEKIPRIAAAGFRHIEFWGWRDKHILAIQAACRNHDVQIVNFSGHRTGSPIAEKTHPVLFADLSDAVPTARTLGCQTLMLLTNALNPDGSVADRFEEITFRKTNPILRWRPSANFGRRTWVADESSRRTAAVSLLEGQASTNVLLRLLAGPESGSSNHSDAASLRPEESIEDIGLHVSGGVAASTIFYAPIP